MHINEGTADAERLGDLCQFLLLVKRLLGLFELTVHATFESNSACKLI
jgi:hypothetical protein